MNRLANNIITVTVIICLSFANELIAQNPGNVWMQYAMPEEAGFSSDKLKSVTDLYEKNGASAMMVVYNGNVLLSKGDIVRRYDCHSMRKSLVSALYGIYSSQGKIDIHKTLKNLVLMIP
jgi:hypothetical protein